MNLEGKVTAPDKNRYGISYYQEEKNITDAILSVVPDAVVKIENYEVRMALDLEVNEDLPETAAAAAQNIFETSGFEASIFGHMSIYLIDEEGTERGRIFFYKHYDSVSWIETADVTDGHIYVWGIFMNGRLERYKEAFKNIVETDPFYAGLTIEGDTRWTFDS